MERFDCWATDSNAPGVDLRAGTARDAAIEYAKLICDDDKLPARIRVQVTRRDGGLEYVIVTVRLEYEACAERYVDPITQPLFSGDGRVDHGSRGEEAVRPYRWEDAQDTRCREAEDGAGLRKRAQRNAPGPGVRPGRAAGEGGGR